MSGKIKGKDLSYDSTLPPFLQRLHAQSTGSGDADRHQHPIARPKRIKELNDEDDPTVVDDAGEVVSKEELAQRMGTSVASGETKKKNSDQPKGESEETSSSHERATTERSNSNVTEGLIRKKRKAVQIVGHDDQAIDPNAAPRKNVKKMKKPIKLTFDDND